MLKIDKKNISLPQTTRHFFNQYSYMFWCLGIGDFLTLDSFLPDFFYDKLKKIFLFTSRNETFKQLIKSNKNYSSVEVVFADNKYDKGEIYKTENYLYSFCKNQNIKINECFQDDLLIWKIPFLQDVKPKISSFFTNTLCKINYEFLKNDFCVICPTTKNTRDRRFFNNSDWIETIKILRYNKLTGIIIGNEKFDPPKNKNLLNLSGRTSILEAIEITKKAKFYIGIDSFLSTLAMQLFPEKNIYLKSTETHLFDNIKFFSPFKNNTSFVSNAIKLKDAKIKF